MAVDTMTAIKLAAVLAAVAGLVYLVKKKGAASDLGAAVGGAVVDAVVGVTTGVVDGVSVAIGIPTTSQTLTNADECKTFMDQYGVWDSVGKCSLPAFMRTIDLGPKLFPWMPADTAPRQSTSIFDRQL